VLSEEFNETHTANGLNGLANPEFSPPTDIK